MMFRIVTHPESENRAPSSFRRSGERYWTCAEVPIEDEWVFLIRTKPDQSCPVSRAIVVVTVEKLLELLAELGEEGIRSVHLLCNYDEADSHFLALTRIAAIHSAEDSKDGWRRVFVAETERGLLIADGPDERAINGLLNRTRMATFPVQTHPVAGIC